MQYPVRCKNCGLKWLRVIPFGDSEYNGDIQYNCPACGSNWYEGLPEETVAIKEVKDEQL